MFDPKFITSYLGFRSLPLSVYFELSSASKWYENMEDWLFFHAFLLSPPTSPE